MSRRGLWAGWIVAVLAMAAFASLGRWQLGRMHEKQAMLEAVGGIVAARDPRPLARAGDADSRYDWSAGEGSFDAGGTVLLDNQQRAGRAGVRVYRVFEPREGVPLLVELGWLPLPGDRTLPAIDAPAGEIRVQGLLAPPPSHGIGEATLVRQPDGNWLATGLDLAMLRETLRQPRLAPRILKLDPALPIGYERDLDILPNTLPPEKHLGYAVQWFGLALAVFIAALILTFRKPRR